MRSPNLWKFDFFEKASSKEATSKKTISKEAASKKAALGKEAISEDAVPRFLISCRSSCVCLPLKLVYNWRQRGPLPGGVLLVGVFYWCSGLALHR